MRRMMATLAVALMALTAFVGVSTGEADAAEDLVLDTNAWFDPGIFVPINFAPVYNNYFTCVSYGGSHWVYTDFVDWNDPDESLYVDMIAYTGVGWRYVGMDVSNSGGHGVFFYDNISHLGGMSSGWVRATDPHGATSGWIPVSC